MTRPRGSALRTTLDECEVIRYAGRHTDKRGKKGVMGRGEEEGEAR